MTVRHIARRGSAIDRTRTIEQSEIPAIKCSVDAHVRIRSSGVGAPRQVVEEFEAPPGGRPVASASGKPGVVGAADLDEAVSDGDQLARVEMAVDQAAPAERETLPGDGVFQQQQVVGVGKPAKLAARLALGREPVFPCRGARDGRQASEDRQSAPLPSQPDRRPPEKSP